MLEALEKLTARQKRVIRARLWDEKLWKRRYNKELKFWDFLKCEI